VLFCAVFASPHGGFFAVASDDFKESDFHRGNPEKGATSDGIVSSKTFQIFTKNTTRSNKTNNDFRYAQ